MKTRSPVAPQPAKKPSKTKVAAAALNASFRHVAQLSFPPQLCESTMIFYLPLSPISANSRFHWRSKAALNEQYAAHFDELARLRLLPRPPDEPWAKASLHATFHTRAQNDLDNLIGRCKGALDLLTKRGFIVDDNPKCLEWAEVPRQIVSAKTPAYLLLILHKVNE